jgi:hypothetical protein
MEEEGYHLLRPIDGGGFADVWEARDRLNRPVAFKVIRSVRSREEAVQKRFERERFVHGKLRHDNIVRVFNAGKSPQVGLWMAMELMERTLGDLLEAEGPLGLEHTIELLAPIADALDYAHSEGSVHRDVKPSNILLDDRGRPHLSDFGLAMARDASRMTETGALVGTRGYAPPEQATGEEVTGTADVYSLAVVLFECLTNSKPNPVAKPDGTIDWSEVPQASRRNPALPEEIDAVIAKGMSDRPTDRQQTAAKLIEAARTALGAPPRAVRDAARRQRRRRAALLAPFAAVLLLVFGIGVGAAARDDQPPEGPMTARAGDVELKAPPGWRRQAGDPSTGGLALATPINLRPGEGADPALAGMVVTAGVSSAAGSELLPSAYRSQPNANRRQRVPLELGSLRGYRYSQLVAPGSGDRVIVFVAPTTRGVVTLACRMPATSKGRRPSALCGRIASTLGLSRGKAYPLGLSPAFSRALRKRIERLDERRGKARREMRDAADGNEQATAAEDLSVSFRKAASGLAGVPVSQEFRPAKTAIVNALRSGEAAYEELADAARNEDESAYADASGFVEEAEATAAASFGRLARLGYDATGSPTKPRQAGESA